MLPFDFVDLHIDWIRVCVFFCEVSISEAKRTIELGDSAQEPKRAAQNQLHHRGTYTANKSCVHLEMLHTEKTP